jgi:putative hemolysin
MGLVFIFLFQFSSVLKADDLKLFMDSEKKNPASFMIVDTFHLSDTSQCKAKVCQAFKVASGQIKFPKKIVPDKNGSSPASFLCKSVNGTSETFYASNGDEVAMCNFNDSSFILAWDLVKQFKARQN